MVKVTIFMKLKLGVGQRVIRELSAIPQIKEIYFITGEYDLVIMVETKDGEELEHIYTEKIEKIEGITSSNSHLIMTHWKQSDSHPV